MRKKIYELIEVGIRDDASSKAYDIAMIIAIIVSMVPLVFKEDTVFLDALDYITAAVFILDYILRLITADFKLKKGAASFFLYPLTFMALVDLVSILPSFVMINEGFKMLRLFRLARSLRVFRAFKAFRYSRNIRMIMNVFRKQKQSLIAVGALALGYILITALIMFNVESETFDTFFDALYWATISLTTMGYGDIYAVSDIGRLITMVSAIFGIAIVALPAGVISAGFMEELRRKDKDPDEEEEDDPEDR